MQEEIKRLAAELNDVNPTLSILEARSWVELLWEDFETTRARAGREYEGVEVTQKIVRHWIQQYGDRLDDFMSRYPKYQEMIYGENNTKH